MASLTVRKFIRKPREQVYAAWVTPEIMNQWFVPEDMRLVESSADCRVGGSFHAVMSGELGTFTVRCVYQELQPPDKIAFTHRWQEPDAPETLVTVRFLERADGTEVVLTHERLRDEQAARGHEVGWQSTLASLAAHFSRAA